MNVQDSVVIITGASMGIGEATARVFAAAGAKLVLAARSADKLAAIAQSLPSGAKTLIVPTDMTDPVQVNALIEKTYERFGRIDILINNAGQSAIGPVATIDPEVYRQIIELNLFGPLYALQAVVPKMRAQGGGVIINISSSVSKMAIPGIGAYASTKYALNGLSLTARNELAADNIRVVLFHPGQTTTDFGKNALRPADLGNWRPGGNQPMPAPDSAEAVAHTILKAARTEPAEMEMARR
ncbi:SDR family oxidoreductase [Deinococcus sp. Arct2-2]|uniref:SDR family NAD(P)-dependent oxidoreductase n=1 Tax=Deinococcus sp. Arct2-2 TaxID=2568653 RepID=UPI0010A30972|nr:SDR family oxidoreductase [Deinococcus sp. Arct2-2]THF69201.1 SDR family oxidoreductase [Deinococcus sp. Arct2-2]